MNHYIQSLGVQRDQLFFWVLGIFFSVCLLYMAYKLRNKSKIALITLTTTGVFICIFAMFATIVTLMTRISY